MALLYNVVGLSKSFIKERQPIAVLKGVHFQLKEQEALVVLGASGAGKSTLLHLLGTLDTPTAGQVFYRGEELFLKNDKQLSEFRNNKIGFVFQFHHLISILTAIENVMLPLLIRKSDEENARAKALEMLARVGLSHRKDHRPGELSGGEQQRVAIARALVGSPEVLLADEPTGNLDSKTGEEIAQIMIDLQRESNMALLLVTHNEKIANHFSNHRVMEDGVLL